MPEFPQFADMDNRYNGKVLIILLHSPLERLIEGAFILQVAQTHTERSHRGLLGALCSLFVDEISINQTQAHIN